MYCTHMFLVSKVSFSQRKLERPPMSASGVRKTPHLVSFVSVSKRLSLSNQSAYREYIILQILPSPTYNMTQKNEKNTHIHTHT